MARGLDRKAEILLVEDNPGDVELTRLALEEANVLHELHVARDGVEALDFLRENASHADAPTPDLVILDLDLPRLSGHALLEEMRADERLTHIPVIVLTSSLSEEDVLETYKLHGNAFVTKPLDFEHFRDVVASINAFWLNVARLPRSDVA